MQYGRQFFSVKFTLFRCTARKSVIQYKIRRHMRRTAAYTEANDSGGAFMAKAERARRHSGQTEGARPILSVCIGAAVGCWLVSFLFGERPPIYEAVDPYFGCQLAPEYVMRACLLCRPALGAVLAVWLSSYCTFGAVIQRILYAVCGFSCGAAFRLCVSCAAPTRACAAPIACAAVTGILLLLPRALREGDARRPFSESLCCLLIAGGAGCAAVILSTIL
jgi:hypothetical protein